MTANQKIRKYLVDKHAAYLSMDNIQKLRAFVIEAVQEDFLINSLNPGMGDGNISNFDTLKDSGEDFLRGINECDD